MPRIHVLVLPIFLAFLQPAFAARITLPTPVGSGSFGSSVTALPNRNIVVTDPGFDDPISGVLNVGAVHLFSPTGVLISTLRGSTVNDSVGRRIFVLANGNYLVASSSWGSLDQGALTFCPADIGCEGIVSAANSLVGSQNADGVGNELRVFPLTNGNYIAVTSTWDNGAIVNAGAVTWGSGTTGISGPVSIANSLVGTTANDVIGNGDMLALSNGNYVIGSPGWDNAGLLNAGAMTFGNGNTGITGPVSELNSFTSGFASGGSFGAVALSNGNYVIRQPSWKNGIAANAGAATLASGTTGLTGTASPANSLVGTSANDKVGEAVKPLANGNYVVISSEWSARRGAVTFGSGTLGVIGAVSGSNSLIGTTPADRVGYGFVELSNSNYVIHTGFWDNPPLVNVGAVTWGSGTAGAAGVVSASNSLIGGVAEDQLGQPGSTFRPTVTPLSNGNYVITCDICDLDGVVDNAAAIFARGDGSTTGVLTPSMALLAGTGAIGSSNEVGVTALRNGNYVVTNSLWDNGAFANVGAATFANGNTGISGLATPANSLIGSTTNNRVGGRATALSNGNYVVQSASWKNGEETNAGAVTFGSGTAGIVGVVSAANSLVGSARDDSIGAKVIALSNGNYVVSSANWNNGAIVDAGAVTWGSGTGGTTGVVTPANSFVGTHTNDRLGRVQNFDAAVTVLPDGNYVLQSQYLDTATLGDAGATSFGLGEGLAMQPGVLQLADLSGPLTGNNSVIGGISNLANTPFTSTFAYNPDPVPQLRTLIVALPLENRVVLLSYDGIFQGGFE